MLVSLTMFSVFLSVLSVCVCVLCVAGGWGGRLGWGGGGIVDVRELRCTGR